MTFVRDIIRRALEDVGVVGVGQTPLAEDMNYGLERFNSMVSQFNRRRWLVYHTVDVACTTTGINIYSVGLNGNFVIPRPDKLEDGCYFRQYFTGVGGSRNSNYPIASDFNADFNADFGGAEGTLVGQPSGYAVDYPLTLLQSREDWNRIALKAMPSWPAYIFYDPAYTQLKVSTSTQPNGFLYINPVPFAGQLELHILVKDVLATYANLSTVLSTPPEYEEAFEYNLAIRFSVKYNIPATEDMKGLARASLATLRAANVQIPSLGLPNGLTSQGARYNVYSDRVA